jgi:hypothetical protein
MQRWKMQLEEYDYVLEHTKGKENEIADTMSRLFYLGEEKMQNIYNIDELHEEQMKFKDLKDMKSSNIIVQIDNKNIICDHKKRIIIPPTLVDKILTTIHLKLFHPGKTKMFETIKNYLKMKNIRREISEIVDKCKDCSREKTSKVGYGKISGGINAVENFEYVCVDILGPLKLYHFK